MRVFFKTFGCRSNIYDTQVMIANLGKCELAANESDADTIVINSCTVTNGADKDVRDYLNKIKKLDKKILFTGCALESVGRRAFEGGSVFGAFGHSQKQEIEKLLQKDTRFFIQNDLKHIDSTIIGEFVGKSRAFLKIQEGCNFKCSYCIIPSVRGKARSSNRLQILEQIRQLVDSSISEVVLSGTNLGSYGKDTGDSLPKLLNEIFKISGLKRVRLGSLEPSQIKEDFIEILESPLLERHLHIALQHTHDEILKYMRRINRFEKDLALFEEIAKRGFALGTDFIVGFPNESEEIFHNAIKNFKLLPLTHIHAFIYSPRTGTKAAFMENKIPKNVAKERLKMIKNIVEENNINFRTKNARDRTKLNVLIESKKGEFYYGLDQFYNRIKIKGEAASKWLVLENYEARKEMNYAEI